MSDSDLQAFRAEGLQVAVGHWPNPLFLKQRYVDAYVRVIRPDCARAVETCPIAVTSAGIR